ncbi:ABC transporter permease [Caminibacter mediatlanticus]|uniref:ABC transporter permease n=1 Tax=Caminibacter mediatlanticus TaxID=291048 RepID=UPI001586D011|nr:ABC transporter permease [Caminibacter mediatlanticus]
MLLREIQTRFGSQKLGYFWAVIEPMAMIIVFSIIHSHLGSKTPYNMIIFLAISFVTYNLYKDIIIMNLNSFQSNKALFVYKQVKPFDTLISRTLIEINIQIFVTIILLIIAYYLNIEIKVKNLLYVLLSIIWLIIFSFSLSLLFAVLSYFFENFAKIIKLIFLPMFFISGLFFTAKDLPDSIRNILLYNPVLQFEEMIHGFFFYSLDDRYVNYLYLLFWTIIPLFVGLWLYKKSEKKIIMS